VLFAPITGSELASVEQLSTTTNSAKINRFYRYLGRLVTAFRLKSHLSQEQLAGQMKMSVEWVKAIESMTRDVNVLDVVHISQLFKVNIQELLRDGGL
jgi:ribosome-binding protein aMBF1 (putative translation factor)